MSRLGPAMGACAAVICGYGMLLALGVYEFGITHLVFGPAATLALLGIGAVWEERALPSIGRVVKRIWPGYDGVPAPLTLWHGVAIVGIACGLVGALYLYWSL